MLRCSLDELLGEEGALQYVDVLGRYGVERPDQFTSVRTAQCAARDLYLAVQRAANNMETAYGS